MFIWKGLDELTVPGVPIGVILWTPLNVLLGSSVPPRVEVGGFWPVSLGDMKQHAGQINKTTKQTDGRIKNMKLWKKILGCDPSTQCEVVEPKVISHYACKTYTSWLEFHPMLASVLPNKFVWCLWLMFLSPCSALQLWHWQWWASKYHLWGYPTCQIIPLTMSNPRSSSVEPDISKPVLKKSLNYDNCFAYLSTWDQ